MIVFMKYIQIFKIYDYFGIYEFVKVKDDRIRRCSKYVNAESLKLFKLCLIFQR